MPRATASPHAHADRPRRDHAAELHAAVSELVRVYQFRDRDTICCHDISVTQCYALEMLVEHGPQRSQALAAILRLDKSTTSRVVDALVRKGYVDRLVDGDDARAVSLRVTRQGRALHDRIQEEMLQQQEAVLDDLDPSVRAAAAEVVRRLAKSAAKRLSPGAPGCAPECD